MKRTLVLLMNASLLRSVSLLSLVGAAVAAHAVVTQVGTRAGLGASDSIDWGQFGGTGAGLGSSASGTSTNALGFTVAGAGLERRDQGSGWAGNFASGERLLWDQGTGDVTLSFASAVSGVGFNIQDDYYGAFDGTLTAYDSLGNSLGAFSVTGLSSSAGDGSAVFLGVKSDAADIAKIVISAVPNDFAINSVSLVNGVSSVPGPLAAVPFALGLLRRRKRA